MKDWLLTILALVVLVPVIYALTFVMVVPLALATVPAFLLELPHSEGQAAPGWLTLLGLACCFGLWAVLHFSRAHWAESLKQRSGYNWFVEPLGPGFEWWTWKDGLRIAAACYAAGAGFFIGFCLLFRLYESFWGWLGAYESAHALDWPAWVTLLVVVSIFFAGKHLRRPASMTARWNEAHRELAALEPNPDIVGEDWYFRNHRDGLVGELSDLAIERANYWPKWARPKWNDEDYTVTVKGDEAERSTEKA